MKTKRNKTKKYEKPKIINVLSDKELVSDNIPFVGATSVYKTYIPLKPGRV